MPPALPDYYATLGLDRRSTDAQIRAAYRLLAKEQHPDVNGNSPTSVAQAQALNAAYEILSDPARRRLYDHELAARQKSASRTGRTGRPILNITKEVHLRIEEFLRGTRLEIRVNEPANPAGPEVYELVMPADTAPGTRFRLPRSGGSGGFILVRVKARPDFRFKVRGSDLRCDLKINFQRAGQGGAESLRGATGNFLRVQIPPKVARGEIIRLLGEGLPKSRGGRGDLLVRILYTPQVQIRRTPHRY
ncbi:MAG: J domain-containing protein [Pedosphaera sp.]|nr:J domain-containing protein [Pedosphaera sp.]